MNDEEHKHNMELNFRVALHLGWKWTTCFNSAGQPQPLIWHDDLGQPQGDDFGWIDHDDPRRFPWDMPNWATNIKDAWECVEHMNDLRQWYKTSHGLEMDWHPEHENDDGYTRQHYSVRFGDAYDGEDDNPARAIVLAFLKFKDAHPQKS